MDRHRPVLLLILLITVITRVVVVWRYSDDLSTDPDGYVAHAGMLMQGRGFSGPYSGVPTAFRPPGFPLMIAAFPLSRSSPAAAVAIIQIIAGIVTVLLTWQMAVLCGLSRSWANAAAALVALDPMLLRYSAVPMTEVVSACLLIAALTMFAASQERTSADSISVADSENVGHSARKALFCGAAAGVLFGLGALVRPVCLVVTALLTLAALIGCLHHLGRPDQSHAHHEAGTSGVFRRTAFRVGLSLIPAVVMLLTISPWIIRNYYQFHRFLPATTHGGYTLALGNNPDYYRDVVNKDPFSAWDGQALDAWQQRMIRQAAAEGIPAGDEPATDAWMYQQALQAIREQPETFVRACLLRLMYFFSVRPTVRSDSHEIRAAAVGVWYVSEWLLVLAAAAATFCGNGKFRTKHLWLTIAAFVIIHTFYWTDARMRAPLAPAFSILACIGGVTILRLLFRNRPLPRDSSKKMTNP